MPQAKHRFRGELMGDRVILSLNLGAHGISLPAHLMLVNYYGCLRALQFVNQYRLAQEPPAHEILLDILPGPYKEDFKLTLNRIAAGKMAGFSAEEIGEQLGAEGKP